MAVQAGLVARVLAVTLLFRAAAVLAVAALRAAGPAHAALWWLVPVQDVASFLVWIGGFFGNTIVWRGRKYYLERTDFEPDE